MREVLPLMLPARGLKIIATCFVCLTFVFIVSKVINRAASLVPQFIIFDKYSDVSSLVNLPRIEGTELRQQ